MSKHGVDDAMPAVGARGSERRHDSGPSTDEIYLDRSYPSGSQQLDPAAAYARSEYVKPAYVPPAYGGPAYGGPAYDGPAYDGPAYDESVGAGRSQPRTGRDLVFTGIRGLGQTFITAGLVVLLFVVYELFITDLLTDQRQEELTQDLLQKWEDDPTLGPDLPGGGLASIPLGDGFARIRIPAFGADYVKVVIEGTDPDVLVQGPGHYVDSAMPGELGNFALAGHRVSKGSPFLDLDQLRPGDAIVIETEEFWFTYRVLGDPATGSFDADPSGIPGQQIVMPQDTQVVFPVPGLDDPTAEPTAAYLTLTTCEPKFSARLRLIIHAALDGPGLPRADFPNGPPALAES